ncbi:hypothetical protein HOLleu_02769 [Holothuria leucospilota]|uniref:SMB domain-containing protein n=1 Tax=Holothuria leucospilota TaxID=206669 RepID=A0A9Q1CR53_HOLLE|nr:hypothetical protein HOLleu_02769 [Holothuria leucospilota]
MAAIATIEVNNKYYLDLMWTFTVDVSSYINLQLLIIVSNQQKTDKVHVEYCSSDFECTLTCGSYTTASSSCSCHPACRLFGDCCYNHQKYANFCSLDNGDENLFLNILSKYKGHFQCNFDTISEQRYWMVSNCPDSWNGPNNCDKDTYNYTVGTLEDISDIPVISLDGVTFRNIYCAACHEEDLTKLTPWSLGDEGCAETDTFDANSTLTIREKILYLLSNCKNVTFLPPRSHFLTVIPCHLIEYDVIDTCNSTTTLQVFNDNCSSVVGPVKVNGQPFKNTFCVDCYYAKQNNTEVVLSEQCVTACGRESNQ